MPKVKKMIKKNAAVTRPIKKPFQRPVVLAVLSSAPYLEIIEIIES